MSVQRVQPNFSINTICPLVINPVESILTFQTASAVNTTHNVNAQFSSCHPNNYAYSQVWTADQANRCCSNTYSVQRTSMYNYGGRY